MTPIPRDPAGDSALVQTIKQMSRCIRERTIIPNAGQKVIYSSEGVRIEQIVPPGRGGTTTSSDLPVWL